MQKKVSIPLVLILLVAVFLGGFQLGSSRTSEGSKLIESGKISEDNLELFWDVWSTVEGKFVDVEKLDPEQMFYGAMKGVVKSLDDPHSEFLDPEESEEFLTSLEGDLTGIGAEVGMRDDELVIISPLRNSPAEKAGLLPGDFIFKIDDKITSDFSLFKAVKRIRGEAGTQVVLTIFRGEEESSREIAITRDFIDIESVVSEMRSDGIAVVTVSTFSEDTAEEFTKVLVDLALKNPSSIILDLRYNGGGFLDAAVAMTSKLLSEGNVLVMHERGQSDEIIPVSGTPIFPETPLVVLINEGSASASEIVAGALQDAQRATVIGEESFGKGTVQELISSFGNGSTLRITIAKWFTPSGRDVTEEGIIPDIEVELTADDYFAERDPQLEAAVEFLKTGKVLQ